MSKSKRNHIITCVLQSESWGWDGKKQDDGERLRDEEKGRWSSYHEFLPPTPIPPLGPTADLKQSQENYQYGRVWELILMNPPGAAFQICQTSRKQGLKRNQATVSCRSSQQSYLVWACHLSGQWMHEIREGEEEENVSTTEGVGDTGGKGLRELTYWGIESN